MRRGVEGICFRKEKSRTGGVSWVAGQKTCFGSEGALRMR